MPESAVKWRTVTLPDGRTVHIAKIPKGKRNTGRLKRKKGKR